MSQILLILVQANEWDWRKVGRRSEDDYMRSERLLEEGQRRIDWRFEMGP